MAKNKIQTLIEKVANNKMNSKYNLAQYKEGGSKFQEKQKAMLHKRICEEIVAFMAQNKDIPLYFILQVGISKGAYKQTEFDKGYKRFNAEEVKAVYDMGQLYYAHNGVADLKMSDIAIRLIMRYYEKVSKDMDTFKADLDNSRPLGRLCGSRTMDYKELCRNLNIPINTDDDSAIAA